MPRWRLGVALLLPEPIASEVQGLRRALGDGALDRIVPHITLVPPVNVRQQDLPAALAVLRAAAAQVDPFEVQLGPVDTFAPLSPVVKLHVDDPHVNRLREAVFRLPLERPLTFPFVSHVTLCDDADELLLTHAPDVMADYETMAMIDHVTLLREGEGRVWTSIADVELGDPVTVARGGLPLTITASTLVDPEVQAVFTASPSPAPSSLVLTGRRDGEVVGVLAGHDDGSVFVVDWLEVTEANRRQGIASHLVRALSTRRRGVAGGPADVAAFLAARGL